MKRNFSDEQIIQGKEMTEEQAIRLALGEGGLIGVDLSPWCSFSEWCSYFAVEVIKKNTSTTNINALIYSGMLHTLPILSFETSTILGALMDMEPQGAAIFGYYLFTKKDERFDLDGIELFKPIPMLEEIVENLFLKFAISTNTSLQEQDIEQLKKGKSLSPNGLSEDERISKDVLTAIILLSNFPMNEGMFEAGLWSIKAQGLREILCTIFAYSRYISPQHLQNTAKRILTELNPEFVEYVDFVEKRNIQRNVLERKRNVEEENQSA